MATSNGPLIRAEQIGVFRSGRWIVREIDLSVSRQEIVTLIGPNGSGKTTTAKALLGIEKTDTGRIYRQPGLKVGYVPQRLTLNWALPITVGRFMTLVGRHVQSDVLESLSLVGMAGRLHDPIQGLSGGEFQRIMIARTLLGQPDFIVFDEPVQGVDVSGEAALYQLIREICDQRKCGILLISHDLHVVMAKTDTVICLNGHICCSGTPEAVVVSEQYTQIFGAKATGALALYHHDHDHVHGPEGQTYNTRQDQQTSGRS